MKKKLLSHPAFANPNPLRRIAFLMAFLLPACLCAQTTWTGSTNTNWTNLSNWSSGVPTATTAVTIPVGLTTYPTLPNGTTEIGTLTLATNGQINTNAGSGTLRLNTDQGANVVNGRLGSAAGQGTLTTAGGITAQLQTNTWPSTGALVNMNLTGFRLGGESRFNVTTFNGAVSATDFAGLPGGSSAGLRVVRNTFNAGVDITFAASAGPGSFPGFSGNVFNGLTTITLTGPMDNLYLGAKADQTWFNDTAPFHDTFNANLTLNSSGTRSINIQQTATPMHVGGNLAVNCTAQGAFGIASINVTGTSVFSLNAVIGNNGIQVAQNTSETATFGGNVSITNSNSTLNDLFLCARQGNVVFNGNLTVESNGGASGNRNIKIGDDPSLAGTVALAAGRTIGQGAAGISVGEIHLSKITQTGTNTHTHTLNMTGASTLLVINGSTLYGTANLTAPRAEVRSSTFYGAATLQQTSTVASTFVECGGNIFKENTQLQLSGTGQWLWGRLGKGGADVFEKNATIRSSENSTPLPPRALYLATSQPTGLNPTGTPAAGSFSVAQRDAVYATFTDARTAALAAQTNAQTASDEATYMVSFVAGHATIAANAATNLTAANSNATSATSTFGTYPNAASVADLTKLNDLISKVNALNTNTNARNASANANNTSTNAENQTSRNLRNNTGLIQMADNTTGNQFLGITTVITQNRGRIVFASDVTAIATFGGAVTATNTGTGGANGAIAFASFGTAVFNGTVTSQNNFTIGTLGDFQPIILFGAPLYGTATGKCTFNANIILESNGAQSGRTQFGSNAAGANVTQTLASGKTLTLSNFNYGDLVLNNLTQTGTGTPHSFVVQPGARLIIGRRTVFNSDVTIENRSISAAWPGGVTIAASSSDVDVTFNGNLTLRNLAAASNNIITTYRGGSSLFLNGNVVLESTGNNRDISFGEQWDGATTGTVTLASGKTITVGGLGFAGTLNLLNFKQLGTTAQAINMSNSVCSGSTSMIRVDRTCEWGGDVAFAAANFELRRSTYYGTVNMINWCQATGGAGGGNTFKKSAIFTFRGPNYWVFGSSAPIGGDTFEADVQFNNENTGTIYVANEGSTVFNLPVTLRNNVTSIGSPAGRIFVAQALNSPVSVNALFKKEVTVLNASTIGVTFSDNGLTHFEDEVRLNSSATGATEFTPTGTNGSTTLKPGAKFVIGAYTAGNLTLRNVTQQGTGTPQILTNIANPSIDLIVKIGPNTTWNSDFTCVAPRINLSGATYNGTAVLESNWTNSSSYWNTTSDGGNTYNGVTTIRNSGGNNTQVRLAGTTGDDFNNNVTFDVNHVTGGEIYLLNNTTTFAGNIHIRSLRDNHFAFGEFWNSGGAGCNAGTVRFDGSGVQAVTSEFLSAGTATSKSLFFRNIEMSQQTALSSVTFDRNLEIRNATFTMGRLVAGASIINLGASSVCGSLANNPFAATPIGFVITGGNANSYIVVNGTGYARSQVATGSAAAYPVGNALHYLPLAIAQGGGGITDVFRVQVQDGVNTAYNASNTATGTGVNQYFANGVWAVSEESTTGSNNLTLVPGWSGTAELADFDRSRTLVAKYNKTTSKWRCLQTAAPATTVLGLHTQPVTGLSATPTGSPAAAGFVTGDLYAVASTSAFAGPDQTFCVVAATNSFNLNANTLNAPFSGKWTRTSGPGTVSFGSDINATTAVSVNTVGTHTFRWNNEGLEGSCGGTNYDEVTITVGAIGSPPVATAVTWTGGTSRNWFDCANWTPNKVPDTATDAILADVANDPLLTVAGAECRNLTIPAGALLEFGNATASLEVAGNWSRTGAGSVTGTLGTVIFSGGSTSFSGATSLQNVTLNKNAASTLALLGELTVNGQLTLTNGVVQTTTANQLVIADNATTTSGSNLSHVQGPMRKLGDDAFAFPVGKSGRWARIGITDMSGASASTAFQAEYFIGNPNGSHDPLSAVLAGTGLYDASTEEYWQLDRTATSANARVTLYWESNAASGINQFSNDLRVIRFNGTQWEDKGSILGGGLTAGSLGSSAVQAGFSPWTFGSITPNPINPLPVGSLTFRAAAAGKTAVLRWTTTAEKNVSHFEVERSTNNRTFASIGRVAAGNRPNQVSGYGLVDENPATGLNYYRIRITDLDGRSEFSKVEVVRMGATGLTLAVYPNPAHNEVYVQLEGGWMGKCVSEICDLTGRRLQSETHAVQENQAPILLSLAGLPSGTYLLRVTTGSEVKHIRVVRQ